MLNYVNLSKFLMEIYNKMNENNTQTSLQEQITEIFNRNKVNDLKKFLNRRHCLNHTNIFLIYLFYVVQSTGILLTTIATSNNNTNLVYLGISLNLLASIINVYEKINNSLLKNMMVNIQAIHDNTYIDESTLVDLESIDSQTQWKLANKVKPTQTTQPQNETNIQSTNNPLQRVTENLK